MTKPISTLKQEALHHLDAALNVKFRDDALRDAIKFAVTLAQPQAASGRTHLEYENLIPGGQLTCRANPGLLMRNGKRTGRVWFFRYRDHQNMERHLKLGVFPEMSVAQARAQVEELRNHQTMGKPLAEETAPTFTVADLCQKYLIEYAYGTKTDGTLVKRSGKIDERLLRKHIIPHCGSLPATDFDANILRRILSSIAKTAPREAEKVHAVVSTMFNVACGRSRKITYTEGTWLPSGHMNPADEAKAPEHTPTTFCPDADQLQTFVEALADAPYGKVLRLQLLTATRVNEAAQLPWAELDLDNGTWDLPSYRSKNGTGYTIELSRQAMAVLQDIMAKQSPKSEFVFPAPMDNTKPMAINLPIGEARRIRKANSLPDGFSTHAMRHAALTWLREQLCPLDIRNAISNHRSVGHNGKIDSGYTKNAQFEAMVRDWLQRWGDHIDALSGQNIVKLPTTG